MAARTLAGAPIRWCRTRRTVRPWRSGAAFRRIRFPATPMPNHRLDSRRRCRCGRGCDLPRRREGPPVARPGGGVLRVPTRRFRASVPGWIRSPCARTARCHPAGRRNTRCDRPAATTPARILVRGLRGEALPGAALEVQDPDVTRAQLPIHHAHRGTRPVGRKRDVDDVFRFLHTRPARAIAADPLDLRPHDQPCLIHEPAGLRYAEAAEASPLLPNPRPMYPLADWHRLSLQPHRGEVESLCDERGLTREQQVSVRVFGVGATVHHQPRRLSVEGAHIYRARMRRGAAAADDGTESGGRRAETTDTNAERRRFADRVL